MRTVSQCGSMLNPVELFVGMRYLRAKRRTRFVSFITLISLVGIALGVAALIVILSVMNGFEGELRKRLLSMSAHGTISGVVHAAAMAPAPAPASVCASGSQLPSWSLASTSTVTGVRANASMRSIEMKSGWA